MDIDMLNRRCDNLITRIDEATDELTKQRITNEQVKELNNNQKTKLNIYHTQVCFQRRYKVFLSRYPSYGDISEIILFKCSTWNSFRDNWEYTYKHTYLHKLLQHSIGLILHRRFKWENKERHKFLMTL